MPMVRQASATKAVKTSGCRLMRASLAKTVINAKGNSAIIVARRYFQKLYRTMPKA